jgi:hypothetical protein
MRRDFRHTGDFQLPFFSLIKISDGLGEKERPGYLRPSPFDYYSFARYAAILFATLSFMLL